MTEQQRTTLPVCPECGSATFWNNTDGVQTLFCMDDDCKWKQQIRSRPAPPADISAKVKEIREMAVLTQQLSAEHDAAIRKATIYELLKDLGYGCPGGEVTQICEMCKANQYCTELRREVQE